MANHTKGGLQAAYIENIRNGPDSGPKVYCMFNPFEYTITKSNSFQQQTKKGKNSPKPEFTQGGKQVLTLALHFDTQEEGTDVRDLTDPLWDMMMVDENKENKRNGKSMPPEVAFAWGKLYFRAYITHLSQKFTLFKGDGTPLRCTVDVTLEQFQDINDYRNPTDELGSLAEPPKSVTVTGGDRPDNTAAIGEVVGEAMRRILELNNIDDPLRMRPGQNLRF